MTLDAFNNTTEVNLKYCEGATNHTNLHKRNKENLYCITHSSEIHH